MLSEANGLVLYPIRERLQSTWLFVLKWSVLLSGWAPLFVVIICSVPINFILAEAVKKLPAATVYAALTGIGTAGTAIIGMAFFHESTILRTCAP